MVSHGSEKAPAFYGRGAHILDYDHQVRLWMRTTRIEASAGASVLILHMQPAPRQVCRANGGNILGRSGGATKILQELRNYFAPKAADAIHQHVTRYLRFRRTDQSIDEYLAEYDFLRNGDWLPGTIRADITYG